MERMSANWISTLHVHTAMGQYVNFAKKYTAYFHPFAGFAYIFP